ncbi:acetoin reductase [Gloeophyllum trabeum ATCC 11539]|uniref:Acetoin reductase n=1 Tax=Gloeophyllum trabeum (strain ATCC 11539 / FP-39264 / Madison 617) TaxID=670483 RepID=S7PY32_GLOTA|nr:acetoin reductase [Gloeophyllum trabeum ATCC 11539]EPQ52428.1 acetoin reductase [Gloeophyllum trabeum ATCC 11539]
MFSSSSSSSSKGVALVTGSAQGIGRGIALKLADDGFDVALNDIAPQKAKLEQVVAEITAKGRRSISVTADVSNEDEVKAMVDTVAKELGGLDVMVANAGIARYHSLLDTTVEAWDRIHAINLRGVFLCYKHAAAQMLAQGRGGRIVGASSMAGKKGAALSSAYAASKFGVRGLTQSAALELGKAGITVNAYAPGPVEGPLLDEGIRTMNETIAKAGGSTDLKEALLGMTAVGALGTPADIAALVSFLASKEARFITGQTISVDGGINFD